MLEVDTQDSSPSESELKEAMAELRRSRRASKPPAPKSRSNSSLPSKPASKHSSSEEGGDEAGRVKVGGVGGGRWGR